MVTQALYIVDLSVLVRHIDAAIVKILGKNLSTTDATYNRLLTAMLLVHFCNPPQLDKLGTDLKYAIVLVKDSKPYWRTQVYEQYKANRKAVPEQLYTRIKYSIGVADNLIQKLQLGYSVGFDNFEADDIAAAYAKMWRDGKYGQDTLLVLDTMDSDWCGLISDSNRIVWVEINTQFTPYIRDEAGFQVWCANKKPVIRCKTPADLYKWKQKKGDASDNLPAGCDLNLIDLIAPTVNLFSEYLPVPSSYRSLLFAANFLVQSNAYIATMTNAAKRTRFNQIRID
jgi:5'-3' exonuclease